MSCTSTSTNSPLLNVHDYAVPISFAGTAHCWSGSCATSPATSTSRTAPVHRSTGHSTSTLSSANPTASSASSPRGTGRWRWRRRVWRPRWQRATPWCSNHPSWRRWPRCGSANCASRPGLPAGLVNVVPAGAEGGEALVRHPGIRKIHFTGGGATARAVLAGGRRQPDPGGGRTRRQVGQHRLRRRRSRRARPMLSAHQGPLMQSGQSCACASRVLVHESVYDAFVEKFLRVIDSAKVGDPFDPTVFVRPGHQRGGGRPDPRRDRRRRRRALR